MNLLAKIFRNESPLKLKFSNSMQSFAVMHQKEGILYVGSKELCESFMKQYTPRQTP
ncbi:hypothetical protein [Marinoscillum furvescens]|uniref:Uncharacterized protein n=1 Tax=Marinoscillum furvescens DSM 4134 TaxID=1122208 RepID=A0A3D9L776_MARFU|nr:hypothetical protein [Marinoscillum furvescens]REE01198.1 hypothetical protein C7460_104218 [Marinoscillum furvescens DSM 4134]